MRTIIIGVVLGTAACGHTTAGGGGDAGACSQPASERLAAVRIVSLTPRRVPLHGGRATLVVEGTISGYADVTVNGVSAGVLAQEGAFDLTLRPAAFAQPIDVAIVDRASAQLREIARLDCAGEYVSTPPAPALALDSGNALAVPLRPELRRTCARFATARLVNQGDEVLEVGEVTLAGSPGFTIVRDRCHGVHAGYGQMCEMNLCFSSSAPMVHEAQLQLATNAGVASLSLAATVEPPTPGLDAGFHGTGGVVLFEDDLRVGVLDEYIAGAALLHDPAAVVSWRGFYTYEVLRADDSKLRGGVLVSSEFGVKTQIADVQAAPPGQGLYVLVTVDGGAYGSLVRFDDVGQRDPAFGADGEVTVPFFGLGSDYPLAILVQPGGRVLVVGREMVHGFTPRGEIDSTFGTDGVTEIGSLDDIKAGRMNRMDARGRIYLGLTDKVLRFAADGGADAAPLFTGEVAAFALDAAGELYVASATGIAHVAGDGSVTKLSLEPAPAGIADLEIDGDGRLYAMTSRGEVLRYRADGRFDASLGFGSTRAVLCPASGGCYLFGNELTPVPRSLYGELRESYVLRLED